MREWHILNFDFPGDLPFEFLRSKFGTEAVIYAAFVSDDQENSKRLWREKHGDEFPLVFDKTAEYALSPGVELHLRTWFDMLRGTDVHIAYQVKPPKPVIKPGYRICKPTVCMKALDDSLGERCEYEDNFYCLYEENCPFERIHPEFSPCWD